MAESARPVGTEITEAQIVEAFGQVSDKDKITRGKGEDTIFRAESAEKYTTKLLNILQSPHPIGIHQAAAVALKNFVKYKFEFVNGNYTIPVSEVAELKQKLVGWMIGAPEVIQSQLGAAITIIAEVDFYERWENLLPGLIDRYTTQTSQWTVEHIRNNNSVLKIVHNILGSLRHTDDTDEARLKVVHSAGYLCEFLKGCLDQVNMHINYTGTPSEQLDGWFETLQLVVELMHDLSTIDLPQYISENRTEICALLYNALLFLDPRPSNDSDSVTPIETAKSSIYDLLGRWFVKYHEEFNADADKQVITATLHLLAPEAIVQSRYDTLVSKALNFLTKVAGFFADEFRLRNGAQKTDDLSPLAATVIMSNLQQRDSDKELFEDDAIEFIRRDLDGYDTDSRRKAAMDLLSVLLGKLGGCATEAVIRDIVKCMGIKTLAAEKLGVILEARDDGTTFAARDVGINLYMATAAQSTVTAAKGVTKINPVLETLEEPYKASLSVEGFFETYVRHDLRGDDRVKGFSTEKALAQVNAIKYLHNFRGQILQQHGQAVVDALIGLTASENYVVYTYAVTTIERMLFLTDGNGSPVIPRKTLGPGASVLLSNLLGRIEGETQPAKKQENEFMMRCIMRVIIILGAEVEPMVKEVLPRLVNITEQIKAAPSNPHFYYFLFEAMGALVFNCPANLTGTLTSTLSGPLVSILNEDIDEFMPYALQLLAAVVEKSPSAGASESLFGLVQGLLQTAKWGNRGNVPACAKFLSAAIPVVAQRILETKNLVPVLGVFHRLLNTKEYSAAFDILEAVFIAFPADVLDPFFVEILRLSFEKLMVANSPLSLKERFTRFYHVISAKGVEDTSGADYFASKAESMHEGNFAGKNGVYLNIILPITTKFKTPEDRKVAIISLTKTLCDSPYFIESYTEGWTASFSRLQKLIGGDVDLGDKNNEEMITEADPDDVAFGVGFTPLRTCNRGLRDHFPEIQAAALPGWIGTYTTEARQRNAQVDKLFGNVA